MTALSIQPTYPIFTETDGQPLEDGYIWLGVANLDPQGNPISVYWDAALTQLAGQPIRTQGGYPVNSGTPARLYVNSDYSIRVMNKNGSVVYRAPAATERYSGALVSFTGFKGQNGLVDDIADSDGADWIGFQPANAGVARSVQDKLRETVSIKDFGAVGDGITDDTSAIAAAVDSVGSNGTVFFPDGEYKITSTIQVSNSNVWLRGELNARIKRYGAFTIFNVTGSYNKISDLQLMGNKASYPYPAYARSAIVLVTGDFNIISDCQIEDGNSHGILFRTGGAPQFNLVQGNIVLNCEEVGIAHDGGVDNRILGNHVSGCGFEGITLDQESVRCIVDGNRLNANCQTGGVGSIGVDWTDLCVISNNVITASGTLSGITFQNNLGPSNNNTISGNVFVDNLAYGVWLKDNTGGSCNDNVISGNVFRNSGSIKIDDNCQRNILSGNSYLAFPDVHPDSYCRVDNALVNFYAQNTVTRSNVTGDGTAYTVPYDNLVQDRNIVSTGSFNTSTGVFTAPITANYTFSAGALLTSGTGTADSLVIEIVTTAGTFTQTFSSTNQAAFGASITASFFLKRNETAFVRVTVSGGSKDYSVTNNVNANFFTGVLVG